MTCEFKIIRRVEFAETDMAVAIDRIARQAAHFEDIARRLARLVDQPMGRHASHFLLVFIDHHHLVGVEDVVEGNVDDVVLVGEADDAVEPVRRHSDGDGRSGFD